MIRIGFDLSQLAHNGGVASYTRNLSSNLSRIPDLDMVYFYSSLRKPYKGELRNVKSYRLPPSLFEVLFNRWRNISIERFIGPIDIFHSSDWTQPPSKAKKITTYHDVVPLKYPQWSHPKIVEVHKRRLKLVEKEADRVICVSEATKKDLLEVSRIPQDRITVIYEGPTANFKPQTQDKIAVFKKKYNLAKNYILAIGGVGERRNLERIKQATQGLNLVIAGQTVPWLSEEEVELLYNGAQVLLYCSLYEGFGLPILDAFSCGLPVITSNISSMPEVAGDAALLVDPYDVSDIKQKLELLLSDETLRHELSKKGFNQVKKFSWEKCAQQTYLIYKSLVKKD